MKRLTLAAALASILIVPTGASADGGFIFTPRDGQSQAQLERDEYVCEVLAEERTGFNPNAAPRYVERDRRGDRFASDVFGGAAGGALLGVIGGAIAGDVGTGAAIGAGVGATSGLLRNSARRDRSYDRRESAAYRDQRRRFDRSVLACMTDRGYAAR